MNIYNTPKKEKRNMFIFNKTCIRFVCWKLQILMREIKEHLRKWKNRSCFCFGRFSIVKMLIPPKLMYRFDVLPIKFPAGLKKRKKDINQMILEFIWKAKETWIALTMVRARVQTHPDYMLENSPEDEKQGNSFEWCTLNP